MTARTALPEATLIDDFLRPYTTDTPLIRVGDFGDGGYLVPDDFRGIAACYSPGVSQQASFEMDVAKRGIPSFMADASVENPPLQVPGAQFVRKFLGDKDAGEFMTLASWVAETDPDPKADLLLQMDIEGAEYETLGAAPRDLLRRFRIIVIELHNLPYVTRPGCCFGRSTVTLRHRHIPRQAIVQHDQAILRAALFSPDEVTQQILEKMHAIEESEINLCPNVLHAAGFEECVTGFLKGM